MMKIGILTSSRADFGIYLPLLKALKNDPFFDMEIIAFGTHLSNFHGKTINEITNAGFEVKYRVASMLTSDDPASVAGAYALTALRFADLWNQAGKQFDWVLCLGDRYEMAAAVSAGIPFNIPFAHLHGGETTLGAIDNIYRHTITLASKLHFVSLDIFATRVKQIAGEMARCVVTGASSLDNLAEVKLLSKMEFMNQWKIDMQIPTILVTIHPETVDFNKNEAFALESYDALTLLAKDHQLVITMPNADTSGSVFRFMFEKLKLSNPNSIHLIENFGTQSYFTCMQYADYMIGNTSSGIVEAASFGKYVINLGNRQAGRPVSQNVIHVPFKSDEMVTAGKNLKGKIYTGANIYFRGNATKTIIETLKEHRV
jgi:GDP/UDP-N,N'-diacetylbacillosamine 2-epimerase (hydrolysing)